ncbi:hypothetical protein SSX86_008527 [Deinandra increscens subsp. villosa]|uniref:Reverse transcriptase Ty1/copia-type domain-containing protein n=1 Tax=Deinandra increscens subsp. villosa TaxID=3103831 RepID=A0AAP0DFE5_9ASTR
MSDQSLLLNPSMKDLTIVTLPATLKLTSSTYLAWKTQVEALLYGLDLHKFIDGTHPSPSPTVSADGKSTPNPAYSTWFRQDRLLFGALVGSLSPPIVPLITGAASSREAWQILAKTYASPTRGHIKQLKHRLKQTTKTPTQSITDYMQIIKSTVDELAILGKKMDDEDVIDIILHGLDQNSYKPIIDAIYARDNPIPFNELHEKLINHELTLTQATGNQAIHQPASVFYAQNRSGGKSWPPRQGSSGHRSASHGHSSRSDASAPGLLPTPNQPRGAKPYLGKCQWCQQIGHSIHTCSIFKKTHPTISIPSFHNTSQGRNAQVYSMHTNTNNGTQTNWLFDSGASHHVTNDLNNLSLHTPYDDSPLPHSSPPSLSTPSLSSSSTYTNPNSSPTSLQSMQTPPSNPPKLPTNPNVSHLNTPPSSPPKRATRPNPKPNSRYSSSEFFLYTSNTSTPSDPPTITHALKHPSWRNAMQAEFDALQKNHTWTLVPSTDAPNLVGSKWVFRTKYNPDGTVDRLKARLVAKGFTQRPGIDYRETFSPVLKPATLRLVLSLAVSNGWPLRQLDINNAFLQGNLHEDVFMAQPPGFVDPSFPNHVCKLNKAIYGLKQASRAWYDELKSFLVSLGFKPTISDSSLFTLTTGSHLIFILVYVDDIIITGSSHSLITKFIHTLSTKFSLKDLGSLSYFLGIEVIPHSQGILLCQKKYITDIIQKANMSDCKSISTPITCSDPLTTKGGTPYSSPTQYRALVGALQYLSLTRPDVAFTVNRLSQFMHAPTSLHWQALKRLLRYLQGTSTHGILIRKHSPLHLHAFTDADWAGDKDNYRSTTGYIVYLGSNPISWSSKRQTTLARSSTEAEFRAVASTTTEVQWIRHLLSELGFTSAITPTVYCDNLSATTYSANPVFHSRMKHLALDFHFVREKVQDGSLRVTHISGDDQLADALTKPLLRPRFQYLVSKIGLTPMSSILRGNINV